jgi:protein phosphatase
MVRKGELRPDQIAGHKLRHVITNVVGGPEAGVHVEARALEIQPGDRLLLCSDGLTEMVPNDEIAAALRAEPDPEAGCQTLLSKANDAGGRDNITVLIARFDPADPEMRKT